MSYVERLIEAAGVVENGGSLGGLDEIVELELDESGGGDQVNDTKEDDINESSSAS